MVLLSPPGKVEGVGRHESPGWTVWKGQATLHGNLLQDAPRLRPGVARERGRGAACWLTFPVAGEKKTSVVTGGRCAHSLSLPPLLILFPVIKLFFFLVLPW